MQDGSCHPSKFLQPKHRRELGIGRAAAGGTLGGPRGIPPPHFCKGSFPCWGWGSRKAPLLMQITPQAATSVFWLWVHPPVHLPRYSLYPFPPPSASGEARIQLGHLLGMLLGWHLTTPTPAFFHRVIPPQLSAGFRAFSIPLQTPAGPCPHLSSPSPQVEESRASPSALWSLQLAFPSGSASLQGPQSHSQSQFPAGTWRWARWGGLHQAAGIRGELG